MPWICDACGTRGDRETEAEWRASRAKDRATRHMSTGDQQATTDKFEARHVKRAKCMRTKGRK